MKKYLDRICAGVMVIVLLVVTSVMFSGCGSKADNEIKIGFICSHQELGDKYPDVLLGMEFAADDIKHKYGSESYSVSVKVFDDKGQSEEAAVQAKKALDDKSVDYIMIMSSDERLDKAAEILAKGKKITFWLDDAGHTVRCDEYSNQFYLTYDMNDRAEALKNYIAEKEVESLNVLYSAKGATATIGKALIDSANSSGIKVDSQVALNSFSSEEFKERIRKENPGAVAVMTGNQDENAKIIRAVKTALTDCIILTDSCMDDQNYLKKNQWLMEDVVIPPAKKTDWNKDEVKRITDRYETLYGSDIQDDWFLHGYFAVIELVDTTINCETSNAKTANKYLTSASSGRYRFNDAGMMLFNEISAKTAKSGIFVDAE